MEPTTTTSASHHGPLVIIVIVLAVLIALGAFAFLFPPAANTLRGLWSNVSSASELEGAYVGTSEGTYQVTASGLTPVERPVPIEVQQAFGLAFNQATQKANPRVSPDGEYVAFQTLRDASAKDSFESWLITLTDLPNIAQRTIGNGMMPFFIDETHVAWVAQHGIMLADLTASGTSTAKMVYGNPIINPAHISVSPDQSMVALIANAKIEVHRVTPAGATLVTTYPDTFTSFGLSDDALYVLNTTEGGTEVIRFRLAEGAVSEPIHTFPASDGITSISF